MKGLQILSLMTLCITHVVCYPDGAPQQACANLAPIHTAPATSPQTSSPPNSIDVDTSQWANGMLQVSLTGADVHGFILQARRQDNGKGVGMFDSSHGLPDGVQQGPCMMDSQPISLTHTNPNPKTNLTFMWMVADSDSFSGDFYFQGAVAYNHSTYWNDIKSATFTRDERNITTSMPVTTTPSSTHTKVIKTTALPETTTSSGYTPALQTALLFIIMALLV